MLSYQHIYHAGNLADVQKHALLAWMLEYLTQKDKPLSYIETHAGRGLYDLGSDEALKTGEAQAGIDLAEGWFPADHPYIQRLTECRAMFGPRAYPGSPMIAALGLRETDTIHLAELHPQENAALKANLGDFGANIQKRDGFEMALALTPPTPRRGLLLIDPSYEVKDDYLRSPRPWARSRANGTWAFWRCGIRSCKAARMGRCWPPLPRSSPTRFAMSCAFPRCVRGTR